ncbi:ExbD/TolR family protein [Lysobacter capsici]|uniref:ExbD/TolR family protein n=1 Tax=Lysobacter capsici TaxID=435897 RepID=UPI00287B9DBC|nr:biopolymer transporter ExbD [Lysobacter capsici]WND80804.1 biopolymer transporter ExbD [Lysobacter capsici]WND86000.1 biopolymer transporter ExbD [Lysobacter capsici]
MAGSTYSASAYSGDAPVAEINVTPLVDVLLVLLVIFMVTAPVLTGNLNLGLPVPGPQRDTPPPRAELMVQASGAFTLDGQTLTHAELPAALKALVQAAPNTVVEVGANADADYQAFAHALSAARESGVQNISTR